MTYQDFKTWASAQGAGVVGTNDSDKGECLGLINKGEVDIHGVKYPITGVLYAKDFKPTTAGGKGTNTRPDLYEWVANNPSDFNQLPSVGDMVVLTVSDWRGHVAYVDNPKPGNYGVNVLEQWQGAKPHIGNYNYNSVVGWWHIKTAPPPVDPHIAQINSLQLTVNQLTQQVTTVTKERDTLQSNLKAAQDKNVELGKVIDLQKKEIERLNALVGDGTKWQNLKLLLKELIS